METRHLPEPVALHRSLPGGSNGNTLGRPTIPMEDLSLRPFERPDFERLLAWIDSPESLMLWAGPFFRFPLDAAQLEGYRASAEPEASPRRIYTACETNGERVGPIELNDIDGHSARLSRVRDDQARRGQG